MDHLRMLEKPRINEPLLITAFAGWNDAALGATSALSFLLRSWQVDLFAEIDPEHFFDFSLTRPSVRLANGAMRRIEWPENRLYYHRDPELARDFILLLGVEPQMKWRTFTKTILALCADLGVTGLVSLGSLVEALSHVGPAKVIGHSNHPAWHAKLRRLDVASTDYEGPTGIVGVLNALAAEAGLPIASIWGVIPSYLSAIPNPKVTLAMLRRLDGLLELSLNLGEREALARQFDARVDDLIAKNPRVAEYVRQIEAKDQHDIGKSDLSTESDNRSLTSSPGSIIEDVEVFLRNLRRESGQ